MSTNCDIKPDSGGIVCKTYIFIKDFSPKKLTSAKSRGSCYEKVYLLKLHICLCLRTKFQGSGIILTSFR